MKESERKYHKALVLFLDILGSQNRSEFNVLYNINKIFHDALLENKKNDKSHTVYKRTIHTFSDCAYIIYDFKKNVPDEKKNLGRLFEVALANCEPLLLQFLNEGFIFRGGISYGDVYYEEDRNLLFGPGINSAYKLENVVAKYPRIAVEDFVAETILANWSEIVYEMDCPKNEAESFLYSLLGNIKKQQGCVVKKDFDGIYMFHYFNSIETNVENVNFLHVSNARFVENLKEMCEYEMKQNETNLDIVQKYGWLLNYIDSVWNT